VSNLGQHDGDGIRYAMHLSAPNGGSAQMLRDPAGGWVSWEDYARLKAEVERLTERNQHLEQIDSYLQSANLNAEEQRSIELEAQVERLTKAGDALAGKAIRLEYNDYWSEYEKVEDVCIDEVEAWHKAKGVQS
jgi:hypothetical protein